ncbi:hypothetical protein CDL15_Pgr020258 [Punica granatum]|uniref:Uncharacterized protein n=1 Tax=Punica granatum TaxID=22663 RepID=A0A218VQZ5_PUNGR|nr:hypothetical protein CDL15_Pgr020258 [Punica granatum]
MFHNKNCCGFLLIAAILISITVIFFLVYLLSHSISKKLCRSLIVMCLAHFALLYILNLHLISKFFDRERSAAAEILQLLGLDDTNSSGDFVRIAVLGCICAIHNHGIDVLFSFSAVVQQTPFPPVGFSILRAGLIKSVLFSVYTSQSVRRQHIFSSHERRIMMYLSAIGEKILSLYRSCGTYIAFLTIFVAVYLVRPNYIFLGYLLFLLLWITGRQLLQKTTKHLWFPLKLYAIVVFIFIYSLSVFTNFQLWLSGLVDLCSVLGYDPKASVKENISEPLAILISMQLFSYERRRSRCASSSENNQFDRVQLTFSKRLLIWHREKILYIAVLYASISPIGAFGFLYILGLVICSILPKSSQVPSKLFLVYSGWLLMIDYLFQMWGSKAEMLPGQRNYSWSLVLGLKLHESTFWGLESGFRGKVVVIVACILQYNIFHWLEHMPQDRANPEKWGEACDLFNSKEEILSEITNVTNANLYVGRREQAMSQSWPSFSAEVSQGQCSTPSEVRGYNEGRKKNQYLYTYFWENYKGSQKWNRRRIIYFRRERLHKQKATLKIYTKFWIQNIFGLFGLEINMVVLLLASFAVLNAISLIYIACLAACIVLNRRLLQRLWPMFVFLFASIVGLEYLALWLDMISTKNKHGSVKARVACHDCWRSSDHYFDFCKKCWFGFIVDDPRMLISYYMVFMFSCFKLKADHLSNLPGSQMYQRLISHCKNVSLLSDLSFETKELWTLLDYARHYSYCHLLDLVLALILITGTLEYDILHLGYLGFALVFFRMRLHILKKKNKVFKLLRIYNFALIVLSLAYQSPFIGDFIEGKCATVDYVSEVIGFYKYDYGFRITSRSAFVEIVIFMLVSVQSFMFSSQEFDYVSKYLEAEQIGAIVREQEKRAAWKSAQLQNIRKSEEQKRQRNLQVEKMKSEMLNLQSQLHSSNTPAEHESFSRKMSSGLKKYKAEGAAERLRMRNHATGYDFSDPKYNLLFPMEMDGSPKSIEGSGSPSSVDSAKLSMGSLRDTMDYKERDASVSFHDSRKLQKVRLQNKDNPLISAVNLIGDGVNQVQSLGNYAVNNLVTLLNIEQREKLDGNSSEDEETYYEIESQNIGGFDHMDRAHSAGSDNNLAVPGSSLGVIIQYIWGLMQSNNDVVCYCCFVLIFLWNFSLLSMVYLGALFVYALCVNTGPSHLFWVIVLMYSEFCILLQYLYQIIIQHCGLSIHVNFLQELGFPENKIMSSFVISTLPLFLVYLFTLLQTSITARDVQKIGFPQRRNDFKEGKEAMNYSWKHRLQTLLSPIGNSISHVIRNLCRYWYSLTQGAETPPYFVQVSMDVEQWPEDGIQPERIESGINELLSVMHSRRCKNLNSNFQSASRVRIQSIERSTENPHIALAVFEVLYASPLTESSPVVWQNSLTPAADVAHEILIAKGACIFEDIGFPYPIVSIIGGGKREIDLYAYIFCADLMVFFLVAFFYQSIIKNKSEFLEVYQLEDQFPKEFVFTLMVIFFLIVLDRIIYLCSFATGKVIFYLFSLALFTYSVTRHAWYTAPPYKRAGRLALRAIYLMKAVSLALQAIQIRYGIPRESTLYRQFLTSSVTKLNFWGFRLYRALPFLYELRCVLDWSCTTTSLTMYDWLKLEDIHASLFLVKCDVDLNRARHRQGEKQSKTTKFCGGICLFLVLICVIWAPMLMYSSGNPTNIANPIKDASVRVDIKTDSGRLTLFETTLCQKLSWNDLVDQANLDPEGYSSAYNVKDIQLICCQPDASRLWLVPPMVQARFIKSLQWSMKIIFSWELTRDRPKGKEAVKYELEVEDMNLPEPSKVMEVLNGSSNSFRIYNVYPRFFRVTGSGDVRFLEQEVELVSGDLVLNRGNPEWWSFHDINAPLVSGCGSLAGPMAVVVSEETPQGILGETLSKFSIWGLYITFVLAVGRFIRLQCADLRMRIPFENLPSCERLLAICEDIYAARAEGELEVEEVLYWTLVKIYRSPHMLLEYTKPD